MTGDHYDLLGVPFGATHDEIKRAYHRLARRHHPDTHSGAPAATVEAARRRMAAINAAWAVLGDPVRRRDYDAGLGRHRASQPPPAHERASQPEYPEWFEPDDEMAAAHLEEDLDDGAGRSAAQLVVFLPVGLAATAGVSFALSVVTGSPGLFALALVLVPITVVAFLAAPFVVMAGGPRSSSSQE